jgi:Xaa-Pro aminopeptidase
VERIGAAVAVTEEVVGLLAPQIRPGVSERQLVDFVHAGFRRLGVTPAWAWDSCPIVVHIDLGVRLEGFCSDLQRTRYVLRPGEAAPPEAVRRAFDAVARALVAGAAALRPGRPGDEVDAATRRAVVGQATRSSSPPWATAWAGRWMTAARSWGRAGPATERPVGAPSRRATSSPWSRA